MSMMAYKATMFMVFFNYAMLLVNAVIAPMIFPGGNVVPTTADIPILGSTEEFGNDPIVKTITTLMLTAGVLALFAFSLLIPTVPFVFMFFGLSAIVTNVYIWQLRNIIPNEFLIPASMGITIIYYVGITQYASRSTFSGS